MKKILLSLLIMIIAVPAFAKDPKETVEYWKSKPLDEVQALVEEEMNKCWNKSQTFFKVPVGSKQWNICVSIFATFNGLYQMSFEDANEYMIKSKEMYGDM